MPDQTRRQMLQRIVGDLRLERQSFIDHYRSLAEFVRPRRGRFEVTDRNRGGRDHWHKIINSRATQAHGIATAGLFNGVMSPTRPWFWLTTDDPDLAEFSPVKEWLYRVQELMRAIFNASNLYNMAPVMYDELLLFGTGCISHADDFEDVARFYAHTVGSYMIAQNDRYEIDTVAREFQMTVAQIVSKFSRSSKEVNSKISRAVRDQYDRGVYNAWYPVTQVVLPNEQADPDGKRSRERPFLSVYFEPGNEDWDAFLSEMGFHEFPFYCPRWDVTGEDIYGTSCPGMNALGDVRALQTEEKQKAQAIAKQVNPPLHGPAALNNVPVMNMPGGTTFYDTGGQQGLRSVYDVQFRVNDVMMDIEKVEGRINEAFHVDLFQAITAMEGIQPRNQLELMQRHQERLMRLGPMLERQHGDFLNPLVNRTYGQMERAGLLPPAPNVLDGRPLKVKYVSTLAMAQQATTTGNIDRLVAFVAALAQSGYPQVLDKFDADQAVDEYSQLIGAPPRLVVSDEQVAEVRAQRARVQQAQTAMEMGQGAANIAKMAGETNMTEDTLAGQVGTAMKAQQNG